MKLYSNEIVFKGHPDKLCDRISDSILDAYLAQDPHTRAGIETMGGKGKIFVTGEVTSKGIVDIVPIIHRILEDANLNVDDYEVINNIGMQSVDIAQGVDVGGAGDQGMMFGYACDETSLYVPKAMAILQEFSRVYENMRKANPELFYADGKAQITGYYDDDFRLIKIKTFTISYQNCETEREYTDNLIKTAAKMICQKYKVEVEEFLINPTGKFLIGSFEGDAGLCLNEDTLIYTISGLRRIKDLQCGQTVYTETGKAKITEIVKNGIKDTKKIKSEQGIEIEATLNHPFRVWNGREVEWKYCGELQVGDILVKKNSRYLNTHDNGFKDRKFTYIKKDKTIEIPINSDFAYLLGWLVGDGNTTADDRITFYWGSEEEKKHIYDVLVRVFPKEEIKEYEYQQDRYYILSKELVKEMGKLGVALTTSKYKKVPTEILRANDSIKCAFLSGLFDADGCIVTETGRDGNHIGISLRTISFQLANEVSVMLHSMGIYSSIYTTKATFNSHVSSSNGSIIETKSDSYEVGIIGLNSIRRFLCEIGFRLESKKMKYSTKEFRPKWYSHDGQHYYISELVRDLVKLDTIKERKYFENYGSLSSIRENRDYSHENLDFMLDMYAEYKETEEYKKVKNIFDNFEFEKIKSIEDSRSNTIDISLDDNTHSFIANGFIVHNTGRKIVVDSYQSFAPVGGGAFSGKDPTKVDRSGAYKARQLAIRTLKKYNLKWCEIQLSYAIGKAEPLAIYIDSDKGNLEVPAEWYKECTPANMINDLKLRQPIYEETACFGHFGCPPDAFGRVFSWEQP